MCGTLNLHKGKERIPNTNDAAQKSNLQTQDFVKINLVKIAKSAADVCAQAHHTHKHVKIKGQEQKAASLEGVR